jgi:replicative DNA helicase
MGKTALALSLARHASKELDNTLFFTMEMTAEQLQNRIVSAESSVDSDSIKAGLSTSEIFQKLSESASTIQKMPLFIDDTGSRNLIDIRSTARKHLREHGKLDLIIIDYLQLMNGIGKTESRQVEISTISRGLKELAKELKIPIIALSQLSRSVEQRSGDNRPQLSDLRESGSIEQDADIVLFLYRKAYYLKASGKETSEEYQACKRHAELIIAKQRNGETGTVNLLFEGEFCRFSSLDKRDEPNLF